jgi:hypothetical protein
MQKLAIHLKWSRNAEVENFHIAKNIIPSPAAAMPIDKNILHHSWKLIHLKRR